MSLSYIPEWKLKEVREELGHDFSDEAIRIIERDFPMICKMPEYLQKYCYKARKSFLKFWNAKNYEAKSMWKEHAFDMTNFENAFALYCDGLTASPKGIFKIHNALISEITQVNSLTVAF